LASSGDVFVLVIGESVNIADLNRRIVALLGLAL
jgi:FlaA1/EpsC-like NDP-sugar epimerase